VTTYQGDPYWLTARHSDQCAKCGAQINRGHEVFWYPRAKRAYGRLCGCGTEASNDFDNMAEQEGFC
jgi:hypothetical protein